MTRLSVIPRRQFIKQAGLGLVALTLPFPLKQYTMNTDNKKFDAIIIGGSYSGLYKNLKLSFAIRNILDRMPPFAPSPTSTQAVAASSLHSTVGRYFMLSADYKFK